MPPGFNIYYAELERRISRISINMHTPQSFWFANQTIGVIIILPLLKKYSAADKSKHTGRMYAIRRYFILRYILSKKKNIDVLKIDKP